MLSKLLITLYVVTTSAALVVLKLGTKNGAPADFINGKLHINLNPYVFFGILLYGISFILYTYLISKYDLGYIIPLSAAFVYVVIFGASFLIFNETFTLIKTLGIGLIVVGLVLLNLQK